MKDMWFRIRCMWHAFRMVFFAHPGTIIQSTKTGATIYITRQRWNGDQPTIDLGFVPAGHLMMNNICEEK